LETPSKYLDALIRELSRLPGIGSKSASRIAFHMLSMGDDDIAKFLSSISDIKKFIRACLECGGISDADTCSICTDPSRDRSIICAVEGQKDVLTVEKTGSYRGLYHVLGGVLSPLDGIGPDQLTVSKMIERCRRESIREVIIATNPTLEGDATALYLSKLLNEIGVTAMRIAHGIPVGSDLDFADSATLIKSISARVKM
jgi:recombination protein RecR